METETYGTIYKTTVSRTLRDRFGAKNPPKRNSKQRSLAFDIEETRKHLHNYTKENSPTKISCSLIVSSDSNDSNDSSRKDLFARFVEPMQNTDGDKNNLHDSNVVEEKRELETDVDYDIYMQQ